MSQLDKKRPTSYLITLLKNTSASLFLKIFGMGIGFFIQVLWGGNLSVSDYGNYTLFTTLVNMISILTLIGMDNGLIRALPREERRKQKSLISKCSVTVIVVIFLELVLYYTFYLSFFAEMGSSFGVNGILFFITLLIVSFSKLYDGVLYGNKLAAQVNFFSVVFLNAVRLCMILIFYQKIHDFSWVILIYVISELVALIGKFMYYRYVIGKNIQKTSYPTKEFGKFVKYTFTLFAISGINIVILSMDKLMLFYMKGADYVGQYKIAENFIPFIYVFTNSFMIFWPMVSSMYKEGKIYLLAKTFRTITKIMALLVMPMFVFMIIYANDFVMIFGEKYSGGGSIMIFLLVGVLVDSLFGPADSILSMTEYAKYHLYDVIFICIVNFVLNAIFIPVYGAIGAALASSISVIVLNVLIVIQIKKFLNMVLYEKINIYLFLLGGVLFLVDVLLLKVIKIKMNLYIEMCFILLVNYILYFYMYVKITGLDGRKIIETLQQGEGENHVG